MKSRRLLVVECVCHYDQLLCVKRKWKSEISVKGKSNENEILIWSEIWMTVTRCKRLSSTIDCFGEVD